MINGPSAVPATPALSSPANGAQVNGTAITFQWNPAARATNYYLQVATDPGFGDVVFAEWVGDFIGIQLTGFPDDGERYYWRVAAGNSLGSSPLSGAWTVVNGPSSTPATPTLSAPANGAHVNGSVITFQWNPAARATDYYLQVATDPGFGDVVFGEWVGNFIGIELSGFADDGQSYYWRVAAGNALGMTDFSAAWSVINGPSAVPATPTLSSPTNGAQVNGTAITFQWNPAARATDYYLQVATDPGFGDVVFGEWVGNFIGIELSGFPDDGQSYYWRVAAGNALGMTDFSAAWSVINGPSAVPATPTLSSPANGAQVNGTAITFQWNPAARATDYYLQVATDPSFGDVVFGEWVGNFIGIELTGFADDGQSYYWRVAAGNTLGVSDLSAVWNVINGPGAVPATPTLNSPANGAQVNGTTVEFRWNPAARATNYYLQVATDADFAGVVFGEWLGNFTGVDLSGFAEDGQTYYWRVAAGNALGSSDFSAAWSLVNGPSTLPATPTLSSPADGAQVNGTTIEFRWNPAARATDYYLQVAIDAGFESVVLGEWIGNFTGADISGFADDGETYYWRVAAGNGLGMTDFSAAWSVVNGPSAVPVTPTLSAPPDGGTVAGTTIAFAWLAAERANNYRFTLATDIDFTSIVVDEWVGNITEVDLTGFADDGQQYYWRVAAGNALGSSDESAVWRVVNGESTAPDAVTLSEPAEGAYVPGVAVVLRWQAAPRAKDYRLEVAFDAGFSGVIFDDWLGDKLSMNITNLADNGQKYYWRVTARNVAGTGPASPTWAFVNEVSPQCAPALGTGSGALESRSHIDSCYDSALSRYFLRDVSRRANQNPHGHNGQMLEPSAIDTHIEGLGMVQDEDNVWNAATQGAAVDAQVHAGIVYDYLLSGFALNSFDNASSSMRSIVESKQMGCLFSPAFWHSGERRLYVCALSGTPFSAALDVVAHEWAHAVTQMSSNLSGRKEAGALNEAFSDWMGTAVEHATGESNWTIGESVKIIRDLANPKVYGQPDTYGVVPWVDTINCTPTVLNDFCGVHTNMGVPNKMFYLLSVGGTHNGVLVGEVGIENAIRIAMRANRGHWSARDTQTLLDARQGMVGAAQEQMFGGTYSYAQTQVRRAWAAVKVGSVPPVADAGPDQTVDSGSLVTLAGSATDQDGTVRSYEWIQIDGPTVALNNAKTATATFTAPSVAADTDLLFRLVVTDNANEEGSSTMKVTVQKK